MSKSNNWETNAFFYFQKITDDFLFYRHAFVILQTTKLNVHKGYVKMYINCFIKK